MFQQNFMFMWGIQKGEGDIYFCQKIKKNCRLAKSSPHSSQLLDFYILNRVVHTVTRHYHFQNLSNIKSLTRGTPLGEREKLWTKPVGGFNFLLILFWQSQSKCSHGPLEGYKPWKNKITKMGKVIIFVTELNLLLPCFGLSALYYSRHLTLPAGPESLHRHTQIMPLYGHSWFNSQ